MNMFSGIHDAYNKLASEREINISKLISVFPDSKDEILMHSRELEIKTYGLKWCYEKALSGMSWEDMKKYI